MSESERQILLYVDGVAHPVSSPLVGALDLGVLQGVGVFETLRVEEGQALFLEEHIARFVQGARVLGIEDDVSSLSDQVAMAAADWGPEELGALRWTRTAGDGDTPGRTWILVRPVAPFPSELAVGVSSLRKDANDPLERIKTTSRARNFLVRREALREGHYDDLVRTLEGDFSEGSATNLFVVDSGTVWTPPVDRGCLSGVTRDKVIFCLRRISLPIRKAAVTEQHLRDCEEVFLTNSTGGVLGVDRITGWREDLPGHQGTITKRIANRYEREVSRYLRDHGKKSGDDVRTLGTRRDDSSG